MIDFALKLRRKLSDGVKRLLSWFLCTSAAEFTGDSCIGFTETGGGGDMVETEDMEAEARAAVTFQSMPPECKLRVFSYLTIVEKGRAERVCSEWRDLIRTPSSWKCVDLTQLSLHCRCLGNGCSNARCYDRYKERTEQLLHYLADIRPSLKEFRFAFDIIDSQDDWLRLVRDFIDSVHIQKLETAQLNWKETPVKPYPSESVTWSSNNYNDLMYRHRRRQRHFIGFFDYFTASATNLSTLILPFDWSASSIRFLGRLSRLESLVLDSYFVPQPFQQETLDDLLTAVPNVKHLSVAVRVGSGGLCAMSYRLASRKLQSLDLSHCQGFSLDEVHLPSLTAFRTSSKPYSCAFLDPTSTPATAPCIYEVLRSGAPALGRINDHELRPEWSKNSYAELDLVLCNICRCPLHKPV